MTKAQVQFANAWMSLFEYNKESILHQLSIKTDFSVPRFNEKESIEIWDYVRSYCKK